MFNTFSLLQQVRIWAAAKWCQRRRLPQLIQRPSAFALCIFALSADGVLSLSLSLYISFDAWQQAQHSSELNSSPSQLKPRLPALVIENASLFLTSLGGWTVEVSAGGEDVVPLWGTCRNRLPAIVALIVLSCWFFGKFVISKVLIVRPAAAAAPLLSYFSYFHLPLIDFTSSKLT